MKLRQNKKGVTLIESIVTIAIIAILLGTMGVALTNIIHYMGESALIKNTSNEIFTEIQDEKGVESASHMIFKDENASSYEVEGVTKTLTKNYNDKDKLSLSQFIKTDEPDDDKPIIQGSVANFYILYGPQFIDKEIKPENSSYYYPKNCIKLTSLDNCVREGTTNTNNSDYLNNIRYINNALITKPSILDYQSLIQNQIIMNSNKTEYDFVYRKNTDDTLFPIEECEIVWYKLKKINSINEEYEIYGYVKPRNMVLASFSFSSSTTGTKYTFIDPTVGITKHQYERIASLANFQSGAKIVWKYSIDSKEYNSWAENFYHEKIFEDYTNNVISMYTIASFIRIGS
ncbi:MAG: Tfp pilus assembly protein FimT/FimU [Longibaculum sp.]